MPTHDERTRVDVGSIVKPHGIRGELSVKLFNPDSEALFIAKTVFATFPDGSQRELSVVAARPAAAGVVLLLLDGFSDRNAAETLRGVVLAVPRAALPRLEEGEFYIHDLMGAKVELVDGAHVGTVTDYLSYPTSNVIVVTGSDKRYEVPLVDDFVDTIDTEAQRVVLRTIDDFEVD